MKKSWRFCLLFSGIALVALMTSSHGLTAQGEPAKKAARGKSLDFHEEAVVEGMNKNPLDSLQHVGGGDPEGTSRLYRKKSNFKKEIRRSLNNMRYMP